MAVGPRVTIIPETGLVVAQSKTDTVLECKAEGKPKPNIHWRKQVIAGLGGLTRLICVPI